MTTSAAVFDPFSTAFFANPHEIYRRMRDEAPVYYSEQYDFYALSRHEDVAAAFKDFDTYSSIAVWEPHWLASRAALRSISYSTSCPSMTSTTTIFDGCP